jgi:hypothetical protein
MLSVVVALILGLGWRGAWLANDSTAWLQLMAWTVVIGDRTGLFQLPAGATRSTLSSSPLLVVTYSAPSLPARTARSRP